MLIPLKQEAIEKFACDLSTGAIIKVVRIPGISLLIFLDEYPLMWNLTSEEIYVAENPKVHLDEIINPDFLDILVMNSIT